MIVTRYYLIGGLTVDWFFDGISYILGMMSMMTIVDIIDILCLSAVFYYMYKFISDRRAGKLAIGVLFITVFLFMSELLEMHAMQFILRNVFQVGMITILIVFHPEIRSALEKMGGESIKGLKSIGEQKDTAALTAMIKDICEAVTDLSKDKTGALIVFEKLTKLGDLPQIGIVIDSKVSVPLIKNIFYNKAPLHDGAVIIRDSRIYAAGCVLPMAMNTDIINDLGMRHRAAIGMSQNSDAVVLVVSEETGIISIAHDGKLKRNYTPDELKDDLTSYLIDTESSATKKVKKRLQKYQQSHSSSDRDKERDE
jgi:TIGR00159 family protein